MYSVDRIICHDGHWLATRVLPSDAEQWSLVTDFLSTPYTHDRYIFLHTFWILKYRACYNTFSFKEFLLTFKEAGDTSDRRSVLYVNV